MDGKMRRHSSERGQEGGHVVRSWSSGLREHFPASLSLDPCSALVRSPFTLQGRQVLLRVIHFRYLLCECHQGRVSGHQQRRTEILRCIMYKSQNVWFPTYRNGEL
jgi:hypothetical protein